MTAPIPALSVEQTATALGVHPNTVYRLIRRRELRAAKVGSVYRIRQPAIDELLSRQPRRKK